MNAAMNSAHAAETTETMPSEPLYDAEVSDDDCSYALFMHLTLLGHLVVPYLAVIAPIVMWMIKKDDSPFMDDHGREAINFQISLMIYTVLVAPIALITCGVGALLSLVIPVLGLVGMILAMKAAYGGAYFRYPATLRFL